MRLWASNGRSVNAVPVCARMDSLASVRRRSSPSLDAFPNSTDKVVAGIITGIGFLGAGRLIRSGAHVQNLTSAAASWASAAMGCVFGAGRYVLGAVVGALILLLLEIPYVPGLRRLDPERHDANRSES